MTLHPQARAALALWADEPTVDAEDVDARRDRGRRAAMLEGAPELGVPVAVEDVDADGVPCRLYEPAGASRLMLYAHGGGFVFGDLETHDGQVRRLAVRTRSAVLAVDYRRPPEHRFPAALDDVQRAGGWLARHAGVRLGLGEAPLTVLGDSAGGNLALVAALRDPGRFRAVVAVYPFLDPGLAGATYDRREAGMTREEGAWYWAQYARPADHHDPDLAPLLSDRLGVLPPLLVQAAGEDVLLDENLLLASLVARAGGEVTLRVFPGMIHGFWRQPGLFDAATDALEELVDFLDRVVPDAAG